MTIFKCNQILFKYNVLVYIVCALIKLVFNIKFIILAYKNHTSKLQVCFIIKLSDTYI